MTALILPRADLERILSIEDVMAVLETAFKEQASGNVVAPPRMSMGIPERNGWFGIMPSYIRKLDSFSTKIVSVFGGNLSKNLPTIFATIVLNDPETGDLLSVMDGSFITAMRTGGLGGLAAKYLSREDSKTVGIFGAGIQARTQLLGLKAARRISQVKVYDPIAERSESYATEMGKKIGIPVAVAGTPADNVKGSDIIVTVSTGTEPVFDGRQVEPGTHINAFGNFKPAERELDGEIVRRSKVVVDLREAALAEAGDLIMPIREGIIAENHILAEMGEIVTGKKLIRRSRDDITLFKSVGLGIQDCAAASLAYRKAIEEGVGTRVDLH